MTMTLESGIPTVNITSGMRRRVSFGLLSCNPKHRAAGHAGTISVRNRRAVLFYIPPWSRAVGICPHLSFGRSPSNGSGAGSARRWPFPRLAPRPPLPGFILSLSATVRLLAVMVISHRGQLPWLTEVPDSVLRPFFAHVQVNRRACPWSSPPPRPGPRAHEG